MQFIVTGNSKNYQIKFRNRKNNIVAEKRRKSTGQSGKLGKNDIVSKLSFL